MYTFFTLIFPKAKTVRHNEFSRVLLPKPHGDVLKDARVTLLRELRCLENSSGRGSGGNGRQKEEERGRMFVVSETVGKIA